LLALSVFLLLAPSEESWGPQIKMAGLSLSPLTNAQKMSWSTLKTSGYSPGKLCVVPQTWDCYFIFDKDTFTFSNGFVPPPSGAVRITATNTVTNAVSTQDTNYIDFDTGPITVGINFNTSEASDSIDTTYNTDPSITNPVQSLHTCTIQFIDSNLNPSDFFTPAATSSDLNFTPCQTVVWGDALYSANPDGYVVVTWPDATFNGLGLVADGGQMYADGVPYEMSGNVMMPPGTVTVFSYQGGANFLYSSQMVGMSSWTTYPQNPVMTGLPKSAKMYDLVNDDISNILGGYQSSVSITFDDTPGTSLTKARIVKPGDSTYSWVPIVITNYLIDAFSGLTGNEISIITNTDHPFRYSDTVEAYTDSFPLAVEFVKKFTYEVNSNVYSGFFGLTNKLSYFSATFSDLDLRILRPMTMAMYNQNAVAMTVDGIAKSPTLVRVNAQGGYTYAADIENALVSRPSTDMVVYVGQGDLGVTLYQRSGSTLISTLCEKYSLTYFANSGGFLFPIATSLLASTTTLYIDFAYWNAGLTYESGSIVRFNDKLWSALQYVIPGAGPFGGFIEQYWTEYTGGASTFYTAEDGSSGRLQTFTSSGLNIALAVNNPGDFYYNTSGQTYYVVDSSVPNGEKQVQSQECLYLTRVEQQTLQANSFYAGTVAPTWTSKTVVVPTGLSNTVAFTSANFWSPNEGSNWYTNRNNTTVQAGSEGTVTTTMNTLCYNTSASTLNYVYTPGSNLSGEFESSGTLAADQALYVDSGSTAVFTIEPTIGDTTYTIKLINQIASQTQLTVQGTPTAGQSYTDDTGLFTGIWNTISSTSSALSFSGSGDFFLNESGSTMYFYSNLLQVSVLEVLNGQALFIGLDDATNLGTTDYIFKTSPISATTIAGPAAPSEVYVWTTGSADLIVWHTAVINTTAIINDLSTVPVGSTSTNNFLEISFSNRPIVAYNSTNGTLYYKQGSSQNTQYSLQASKGVYISASTAKFYSQSEQNTMSAPAFVATVLSAASTTVGNKPKFTLPIDAAGVATSNFGSIVKKHIADGDTSAVTDAVTGITTGGRMAVKFHLDYTKVLEDAIDKKIVQASTSAFVYSGSIDLSGATGYTAYVPASGATLAVAGTPGELTYPSTTAIVVGSYFKTYGGVANRLYNVTITGPSAFTSTVLNVSHLDALVWNGTSFDNLASFDSAVTIGGDVGTGSAPYLSVSSDASSDGYILHFNGNRLNAEIATCLQDAKDYTDDAIGTLPDNVGTTVSDAVVTLLANIGTEVNRARAAETLIAQTVEASLATARTRLQLLEAFMYTSEQYMELTDSTGAPINFSGQILSYATTSGPASDFISSVLPSGASVALTGASGAQTAVLTAPSVITAITSVNALTA
jgi:hypothetical protein